MISYIFLYKVTLNSLNVFQKLVIYKVYTVTQGIKGCLFYKQCCCIGGRGEIKPYSLCEANPYNNIVTFRGITLSKNSNNSDTRLEANKSVTVLFQFTEPKQDYWLTNSRRENNVEDETLCI